MENLYDQILPHLNLTGRIIKEGARVAWCPFHDDGNGKPPHQPNFHLFEHGYLCHACGEKGNLRELAHHLGIQAEQDQTAYVYEDAEGKPLFRVVRLPGKKFMAQHPNGAGWVNGLGGVTPVPYHLPELLNSGQETPVFIVEGEKDVDRLAREGFVATTNPFGAGKWRDKYSQSLKDRMTVILGDNDDPGRCQREQVAASLTGIASSIRVPELPGLGEKEDISDWLNRGNTVDQLHELVEATPERERAQEEEQADTSGSKADRLVGHVLGVGTQLFCDDRGEAMARIEIAGHLETWPLRSGDFETWISGLFYRIEGKTCGSEALNAACRTLAAKAKYEGDPRSVHNRVASGEGCIWLDLSDSNWRAVRIGLNGWKIVPNPSILFRRYKHQKPHVEPEDGGSLDELFDFVNIRDPAQKVLLKTYLVSCLVPDIPHPVLVAHGPQGSAKTTLFRVIRRLIDPSILEVLDLASGKELVQALAHHWLCYYDNLSSVTRQQSDLLCRAVTGEGFSKRVLYSDDDDFLYQFRGCPGLNGINVAARNPDLLERSILIELLPIEKSARRTEAEFWKAFEEVRPRLLGAALTILSQAMKLKDQVKVESLPRMADFTVWGYAIAEATGDGGETFLQAYEANAQVGNEQAIAESEVAEAVRTFVEEHGEWKGTPTDLLCRLEPVAETLKINTTTRGWPKAPNTLTRKLNELKPALAAVGIEYTFERTRRGVQVSLKAESRDGSDDSVTVSAKVSSRVNASNNNGLRERDGCDDTFDDSTSWEERAAIMEYEGNLPRDVAERLAGETDRQ